MTKDKTNLFPLILLLLLTAVGCAGYRVGSATMYPDNIHTVHVPVFQSDSLRPDLGQWLTEAVVKRIEQTTPYKVVSRDHADTVLEGIVLADTKRVSVTTNRDDPRETDNGMRINVRWTDNHGQLMQETVVPMPVADAEVWYSSGQVPEVGQSTLSAQQVLVERLAEQIVAIMEAPW
ncbi:MAG: LPS assembly lipoprotein LptE [Planctomycetales bacterium]